MKTLLFIHWNILYNDSTGEYNTAYIQELHLFSLKKYNGIFDEVKVVLHTDNLHDVSTIHNVKTIFDKIFGNRVSFIVEKNSELADTKTFSKYFLPIVTKYPNDYDVVYYIHNKGITYPHTNNMRVWVASLYYYNFEHFNDHLSALRNGSIITGGLLARGHFDLNNEKTVRYISDDSTKELSTDWHFTGTFFGVSPKNLLHYCQSNGIIVSNKVRGNAEFHFGTFIPEDLIHYDKSLLPLDMQFDSERNVIVETNPYYDLATIIRDRSFPEDFNNMCKLARAEE